MSKLLDNPAVIDRIDAYIDDIQAKAYVLQILYKTDLVFETCGVSPDVGRAIAFIDKVREAMDVVEHFGDLVQFRMRKKAGCNPGKATREDILSKLELGGVSSAALERLREDVEKALAKDELSKEATPASPRADRQVSKEE